MAYTRKQWVNGEVITDIGLNNLEEGAAQGINDAALAQATANEAKTEAAAKAPKSHASTGTTYGKGNGSNYGHVKLSDAVNSNSGVDGGIAATPAAVKAAYDLAKSAAGEAGNVPINHSDPATTYGSGDGTKYGHVKLSDSVAETKGTSDGTAATPSAVKAAYDLANTANETASEAKETASGKAPKNHKSTGTDYGVGDASNYGHLKLSASTTSTSGTSSGIAATPSAVKAAYDLANTAKTAAETAQTTADSKAPKDVATQTSNGLLSAADKKKLDGISENATANAGTITGVSVNGTSVATSGVANIPAASTSAYGATKLSSATNSTSEALAATPKAVKAAYDLANGKAPTSHASTATTYGAATSSNYGHVKLSDSTSSTSAASAGIAASPKAVKTAYDLANAALPKAGGTMTGVLKAQNNTSYAAKQVRNIFLIADGASLPSGANGDICLVYTP